MIRGATDTDADAVAAILNHYIEKTTATFYTEPFTAENRREWIRDRTADHPALVLELAGKVEGICALNPFKARPAYRQTVDSMVYLRDGLQGRGYGRQLMDALIERARHANHHAIVATICAEQAASIRVHEKLGFKKVGHLPQVGRKFGRWLDIVYFQLLIE